MPITTPFDSSRRRRSRLDPLLQGSEFEGLSLDEAFEEEEEGMSDGEEETKTESGTPPGTPPKTAASSTVYTPYEIPDTAKTPRLGRKVKILTKSGLATMPICGNGGIEPGQPVTSGPYSHEQMRPETIMFLDRKPERNEGLDEHLRLEIDGSVRFVRWQAKIQERLTEYGLDANLYVPQGLGSSAQRSPNLHNWFHVLDQFAQITKSQLNDWNLELTRYGDAYDKQNLRWGGEMILNSIGPKLLEKISYGGAADYSGLEALYLIKEATETNRVTKIEGYKRDLRKLSLKDSPTLDAEAICDKLVTLVNQLEVEDPAAIVGGNLGKDVAEALYVNSEFCKSLDLGIQGLVQDFYMTTLRQELNHIELKDRLQAISLRHRTLVGQDAYAAAKAKPNKQDQQIQTLLSQTKALQAQLDAVKGGGDNKGGTNGGKKSKDKSHITCHSCGKKGHYKGDPECPDTDKTKGGQESNKDKHAWKKVAPKGNEPKSKKVGKDTFYWCSKCGDGGMWRVSHGDEHPTEKHSDDYRPPNKKTDTDKGPAGNLAITDGFDLSDGGVGVPGGIFLANEWTTVPSRRRSKRGTSEEMYPKGTGSHEL